MAAGLRIVLLACLLAIYTVLVTATEPCTFQAGEYYTLQDIKDCYYSVPFSEEVRLSTIQTLERTNQLNTFLDISIQSPDPRLPVHVDLMAELDKLRTKPYQYDFDFHDDLRALFNQLFDAHCQYYGPQCYQNMKIRQAFAPIGWGDNTDNYLITVSNYFPDDLVAYYAEAHDIDIRAYYNHTIEKVDGVPSYQYFMTYANTSMGMCKDPGTRFNFALTVPEPNPTTLTVQYGYWQQRSRRNPLPDSQDVVFHLRCPCGKEKVVTVPWSFKALKTYTGLSSFLSDYYANGYTGSSSLSSTPSAPLHSSSFSSFDLNKEHHSFMQISNSDTLDLIREQQYQTLKNAFPHTDEGMVANMTFTPLVTSTHLNFWELSDGKTLVMYLDTMAPGAFSKYYRTLIRGFQIAGQRGLTQLIIDFTNNGGGNICLGQALIAYLQQVGWPGQGQNWAPQDLALSPLAERLIYEAAHTNVTNTVWSPAFYADQKNRPIANSDTSFMLPGVPHTRGGATRNYTRLVHINECGDYGYKLTPGVDFMPDKVLIVTHGFCGSTCAMVSSHLALYNPAVRTVVVGGRPEPLPMQYFSFPGGQVLDNDPLFSALTTLHQNVSWTPAAEDRDNIVPRQLPTTGTFRFCVREVYPNIPSFDTPPLEFSFQQASYHYYNSELTATSPQYVWYDILDLFNSY